MSRVSLCYVLLASGPPSRALRPSIDGCALSGLHSQPLTASRPSYYRPVPHAFFLCEPALDVAYSYID